MLILSNTPVLGTARYAYQLFSTAGMHGAHQGALKITSIWPLETEQTVVGAF